MIRASARRDDYSRVVERLFDGGSAVGLSEAQLLERFAGRRDEAAFAALVDRHGPMVLGVCRRLLRNPHDADDAFQAVFIILARKAGGLKRKELVGNWLYGVARRVASEARRRPGPPLADDSAFDADARRAVPPEPPDACAREEEGIWLHEEVGRLPTRYRAPVVACYFEGRTHEEAAALLNCPVGTVKGRLARARDLLRARLERRGVTASTTALATALAAPDLRAAVPPALASQAVAGAVAAVASPTSWMTSAILSTSVRSLSEGVIQAMFYAQLKSLAIPATLAAGVLAVGVGFARQEAPQAPAGGADLRPAIMSDRTQGTGENPPQGSPARQPAASPMDIVWLTAARYGESYVAALHPGDPVTNEALEAAMVRHGDRIKRLEKDVRDHAAGDPLLTSLADYLAIPTETLASQSGKSTGPQHTFALIRNIHAQIEQLLDELRAPYRTVSTEFDREVLREQLAAKAKQFSAELAKQAQKDQAARDLLTRVGDALKTFLADGAADLAAPPKLETASNEPAAAPAVEAPAPADPVEVVKAWSMGSIMDMVWEISEQYQKSHATAMQAAMGKPLGDAKAAEAMARHVARVERLANDLRSRTNRDRLLICLADYLAVAEKPTAQPPAPDTGPMMTLSLILMARDNLANLRQKEQGPEGQKIGEFDRDLIYERLRQGMESSFDDLARLAQKDERSRELLALYIEYLNKHMAGAAPPPLAQGVAAAPATVATTEPAPPPTAQPAPATSGGFGGDGGGGFSGGGGLGGDGPSPAEVRQKVARLAATMSIVDQDPNSRKAYTALDRPSALKSGEKATLGNLLAQLNGALKSDDGKPIPVYVDPKGLEEADASLDSPVAIDLEGVPLKHSLRLALKQLGLAYCVRDGVLIISSLEGIEQELLEAQREMIGAHPDRFSIEPDGTIRPTGGMGGGMGGMGGGMGMM